jgi:hypothetical protein
MTKPMRPILALIASSVTLGLPASALAGYSVGSPEQVAWVRSAAARFVTAELGGDGATACAVLNAPLRVTLHNRTCAQRFDGRLYGMLRHRGERSVLRAERRAIASATVIIHGNTATIDLPARLMSGPNRFLWTENCWMLEG